MNCSDPDRAECIHEETQKRVLGCCPTKCCEGVCCAGNHVCNAENFCAPPDSSSCKWGYREYVSAGDGTQPVDSSATLCWTDYPVKNRLAIIGNQACTALAQYTKISGTSCGPDDCSSLDLGKDAEYNEDKGTCSAWITVPPTVSVAPTACPLTGYSNHCCSDGSFCDTNLNRECTPFPSVCTVTDQYVKITIQNDVPFCDPTNNGPDGTKFTGPGRCNWPMPEGLPDPLKDPKTMGCQKNRGNQLDFVQCECLARPCGRVLVSYAPDGVCAKPPAGIPATTTDAPTVTGAATSTPFAVPAGQTDCTACVDVVREADLSGEAPKAGDIGRTQTFYLKNKEAVKVGYAINCKNPVFTGTPYDGAPGTAAQCDASSSSSGIISVGPIVLSADQWWDSAVVTFSASKRPDKTGKPPCDCSDAVIHAKVEYYISGILAMTEEKDGDNGPPDMSYPPQSPTGAPSCYW